MNDTDEKTQNWRKQVLNAFFKKYYMDKCDNDAIKFGTTIIDNYHMEVIPLSISLLNYIHNLNEYANNGWIFITAHQKNHDFEENRKDALILKRSIIQLHHNYLPLIIGNAANASNAMIGYIVFFNNNDTDFHKKINTLISDYDILFSCKYENDAIAFYNASTNDYKIDQNTNSDNVILEFLHYIGIDYGPTVSFLSHGESRTVHDDGIRYDQHDVSIELCFGEI